MDDRSTPCSQTRKVVRSCPMCKGKGFFDQTCSPAPSSTMTEEISDGLTMTSLPQIPTRLRPKSHIQTKRRFRTCISARQLEEASYKSPEDDDPPSIHRRERLGHGTSLPQIMPPKTSAKPKRTIKTSTISKLPPIRGSGLCEGVGSVKSGSLIPEKEFPITNTTDAINVASAKLKSNDWEIVAKGLEEIVQIARRGPEVLLPMITQINRALCAALKAPRTRLVRIAQQAVKELFRSISSISRPEFDELVNLLLTRTADSNRSIREDATDALDSLVVHMPLQYTVRALVDKGPKHKNYMVRATVGRLLFHLLETLSPEVLFTQPQLKDTRKRFLETACIFLDDPNMEVRSLAKKMFTMLVKEPEFDECFYSEVDCSLISRVDRALVLLRYGGE